MAWDSQTAFGSTPEASKARYLHLRKHPEDASAAEVPKLDRVNGSFRWRDGVRFKHEAQPAATDRHGIGGNYPPEPIAEPPAPPRGPGPDYVWTLPKNTPVVTDAIWTGHQVEKDRLWRPRPVFGHGDEDQPDHLNPDFAEPDKRAPAERAARPRWGFSDPVAELEEEERLARTSPDALKAVVIGSSARTIWLNPGNAPGAFERKDTE